AADQGVGRTGRGMRTQPAHFATKQEQAARNNRIPASCATRVTRTALTSPITHQNSSQKPAKDGKTPSQKVFLNLGSGAR
ncbi:MULTISPECIES: hypothetical protein, partial [Streptomyces]|uniref:hypothetical protein n=1 Tax=Streptomyces TaxID=1883 RepID=UPI001AD82E55